MKFPDSRPYDELRAELMALLSPRQWSPRFGWFHVCHHCGAKKRTHLGMEFDHLGLRGWEAHRLNRRHRLRMYHREWTEAGALVGLGVVGACTSCNKKRGGQRAGVGRGVYGINTPHGRQRARRGRGYTAGLIDFYELQAAAERVSA